MPVLSKKLQGNEEPGSSISKNMLRLAELKNKIQDEKYLDTAVLRIAHVLSAELMGTNGDRYEHRF